MICKINCFKLLEYLDLLQDFHEEFLHDFCIQNLLYNKNEENYR